MDLICERVSIILRYEKLAECKLIARKSLLSGTTDLLSIAQSIGLSSSIIFSWALMFICRSRKTSSFSMSYHPCHIRANVIFFRSTIFETYRTHCASRNTACHTEQDPQSFIYSKRRIRKAHRYPCQGSRAPCKSCSETHDRILLRSMRKDHGLSFRRTRFDRAQKVLRVTGDQEKVFSNSVFTSRTSPT